MALPLSMTSSIVAVFLFYLSRKADGLGANFSVFFVDDQAPTVNCSPSRVPDGRSLKIVHRHGPCSPSNHSRPSVLEILAHDSLRVASLQARLEIIPDQNGVAVPALEGLHFGGAIYVVKVGLGSPKVDQTVIIDTGNDVCWVQCSRCSSCYPQREPMFDPSSSSSYSPIPCDSRACDNLAHQSCSSGSCLYGIRYMDGTNSAGFLAAEKLTLTPSDVFEGFLFGCGVDNHGLEGAAGLVGLGLGSYSLTSQTAIALGNVFSYCLPLRASVTGWLSFGRSSTSTAAYYTPMLSDARAPSFYYIDLVRISVGGTWLPVTADEFRAAGTIIDSGTTLTHLPAPAYSALSAAFQIAMWRHKRVTGIGVMDTCYDFDSEREVEYPEIKLQFTGVEITLGGSGVFFYAGGSKYCLAFVATEGVSVIGNVQQRGIEVIYDVGAKRIGFAAGTCG